VKIHPSIVIVVVALVASVLAGLMFGDRHNLEKGRSAFMCHVAGQCQALARSALIAAVIGHQRSRCFAIGDAIKLASCDAPLPRRPVAITSNGTPDYFGILDNGR